MEQKLDRKKKSDREQSQTRDKSQTGGVCGIVFENATFMIIYFDIEVGAVEKECENQATRE